MKIIHFTQLRDYAVTDIKRGRSYYFCHPETGEFYSDWFPFETDPEDGPAIWNRPTAYATPFIALTSLVQRTTQETLFANVPHDAETQAKYGWDKNQPMFLALLNGRYVQWNYGEILLDPHYRHGNFVLDRLDLLRRGIVVDTTVLGLIDPKGPVPVNEYTRYATVRA